MCRALSAYFLIVEIKFEPLPNRRTNKTVPQPPSFLKKNKQFVGLILQKNNFCLFLHRYSGKGENYHPNGTVRNPQGIQRK